MTTAVDDDARDDDPLNALRTELAALEARSPAERVAHFEHANAVIVAALAELDEV